MHKQKIHNMLETLVSFTEAEIAKGLGSVCTEELGKAVDMIKDLCEAETKCYEKCYYEKILEGMKEEEEFEEHILKQMIMEHGEVEGRMGYDRWRTSRGRFAPTGQGHETSMRMATGRAGFTPPYPSYDDPNRDIWPPIMGYTPDRFDGQRSDGARSDVDRRTTAGSAGRMGYTPPERDWDKHSNDKRTQYYDAKRYYHDGGTEQDRHTMTERGKEYVSEAVETMRDMFVESDPELQKKIKDDIFRLYREFGGK